jgi:hypothetical protein
MSLFSYDLESHLIQPGLLTPPIVCASWATAVGAGSYGSDLTSAGEDRLLQNVEHFEEEINKLDNIWTGANIAFDFGCLLAVRPDLLPLIWRAYKEARVFDVQIGCSLNAIYDGRMKEGDLYRYDGSKIQSGRYSLDEVVKETLGRTDAKGHDRFRLSYALLEHLPIEQWPWDARQYPLDDASNTLEAAEVILAKYKNQHDLPAQVHSAFCIHLGAIWGLRTDPKRVDNFEREVNAHLLELQDFAKEQGFMRPKSKKPDAKWSVHTKAVQEAVFTAYDGKPPGTPTGEISISRETLMDSGDAILERFAEMGKWKKLTTYVPTLKAAATHPLNIYSNPLLSTGRVSQDGLLLMIPRQPAKDKNNCVIPNTNVRNAFVARDDTAISSCDYAAVELSTLGQCCIWTVGYSDLADVINAGKDPHCVLGADLLGIEYDEFFHHYKVLKEKPYSLIRQAGKAGNFGFPGMMGPESFVVAQKKQQFSVCEWFFHDGACSWQKRVVCEVQGAEVRLCSRCIEQAAVVKTTYLKRWSEVPKYWNWTMKELHNNGSVTQFISQRVRGDPSGPAAANTLFQGLAADGAKRALVALTEEMYLDRDSALFGSRLLNFIHDETLLEIPLSKLHDGAYRQAAVMVEQMKTVVPDVAIKVEPAAMLFWDKEAEAVHDENGKLIPWQPKAA